MSRATAWIRRRPNDRDARWRIAELHLPIGGKWALYAFSQYAPANRMFVLTYPEDYR